MSLNFLLLLAFLGAVCAQSVTRLDPGVFLNSWTDTTTNGPTFLQPNGPSGTGCAKVTAPLTNYLVYNASFTTAGVRQVALLAEAGFKPYVVALLYNGPFDPANSCTNYVRSLSNANFPDPYYGRGSLIIDDYFYFTAGTYYFVVTSNSTANTGIFGLQIESSFAVGTTVGGFTWSPTTLDTGSCNTTQGVTQTASIFTFEAPNELGYFDVAAIFEANNNVAFPATYLSIYEGNWTAQQIQNTPCSFPLNGTLRISAHEGDRSATGVAQAFTPFTTYTAVISSSYTGNWAFQLIKTRISSVTISGYTQPLPTTSSCSASTFTNAAWLVYSIPAAIGSYTLIDSNVIPTYNSFFAGFDTVSFAFDGTLSTATPPAVCPSGSTLVAVADTGNTTGPLTITTTPGKAYSVVISNQAGGSLPVQATPKTNGVYLYVFSSTVNGTAPATSTTTTTTTGTSASPATTGSTTAFVATADAAAIGVPMVLVAAGVLLHFFL